MKELLTYQDLMVRWGCSYPTARKAVLRLGLRPLRIGPRTIRFCLNEIQAAEHRKTA